MRQVSSNDCVPVTMECSVLQNGIDTMKLESHGIIKIQSPNSCITITIFT